MKAGGVRYRLCNNKSKGFGLRINLKKGEDGDQQLVSPLAGESGHTPVGNHPYLISESQVSGRGRTIHVITIYHSSTLLRNSKCKKNITTNRVRSRTENIISHHAHSSMVYRTDDVPV